MTPSTRSCVNVALYAQLLAFFVIRSIAQPTYSYDETCYENVAERISCKQHIQVTALHKNACFPKCFTDPNVEGRDDKIVVNIQNKEVQQNLNGRLILRCYSNQQVIWKIANETGHDVAAATNETANQPLTHSKLLKGGSNELDCYVSDLCANVSFMTENRGRYLCAPYSKNSNSQTDSDEDSGHLIYVSAKVKASENRKVNRTRDSTFQIQYLQSGEIRNSINKEHFTCSAPGTAPEELQLFIKPCLDEELESCSYYERSFERGNDLDGIVNANYSSLSTISYGIVFCETRDRKRFHSRQFLQFQDEMVIFDPFSPQTNIENLIALDIPPDIRGDTTIYLHDLIEADCWMAQPNFTGPPRLYQLYGNGQSKPAKITDSQLSRKGEVVHLHAKINVTDVNITGLACLGQIRGKGTFVNVSCDVVVKEGSAPVITQYPPETIELSYSDTNITISCEATGDPCPKLLWYKEGALYTDRHQFSETIIFPCSNGKRLAKIIFYKVDSNQGSNAEGSYTCNATNYRAIATKNARILLKGKGQDSFLYICLGILLVMVTAIMLFINWRSRKIIRLQQEQIFELKREHINEFELGASQNPGAFLINDSEGNAHIRFKLVDPSFKLPEEAILIKTPYVRLGEGHFGHVLLGVDCRPGFEGTEVAVKQLKQFTWDSPAIQDFLGEIKILTLLHQKAHLYQKHVIHMVGYVADFDRDTIRLVMECCYGGNLEKYLQRKRPEFLRDLDQSVAVTSSTPGYIHFRSAPRTIRHLVSYAHQISCGMEVLEYHRVIHGDLAVRNMLLKDRNCTEVKIADFGLARTLADTQGGNSKPFRLLALECWPYDSALTLKSDAWSFGVLLWEIFSLAEVPYEDICSSDDQAQMIYEFLKNPANRLQQPTHAPDEMYEIMKECWNQDPNMRPSFPTISSRIKAFLDADNSQVPQGTHPLAFDEEPSPYMSPEQLNDLVYQ